MNPSWSVVQFPFWSYPLRIESQVLQRKHGSKTVPGAHSAWKKSRFELWTKKSTTKKSSNLKLFENLVKFREIHCWFEKISSFIKFCSRYYSWQNWAWSLKRSSNGWLLFVENMFLDFVFMVRIRLKSDATPKHWGKSALKQKSIRTPTKILFKRNHNLYVVM